MSTPNDLHHRADRWFIRRGLPQFVLDYRSDTDVWTRASPFLFVTFLLLIVGGAVEADSAGTLLVALAGCAIAVGFVIANVRGGRAWYTLPRRVGPGVLIAYVVIPTALSLVATRSWQSGLATLGSALTLLALAWVVTWIALIPLLLWAVRWTFLRLGDASRLATRALPVLLVVVAIIFFTTEIWQVAGTLPAAWLWASIGLLLLVGFGLMVSRVPREIRELETPADRDVIEAACAGTPLEQAVGGLQGVGEPEPLTRMQRANVGVVIVAAQAVQFTLFGLVVWVFFVLLSVIAVSLPVQQLWLTGLANVDVLWTLNGDHGLTREALRVAAFIAGFSVLYAAVYSASDGTYRQAFHDDIRGSLTRAMSVRQAYLALKSEELMPADPAGAGAPPATPPR
ncbi:MAG: hypothetical protein ACKOT0_07150 [bacterium]